MEENKPINNEEEVKPPNNPQDAVHEQPLNTPSTEETIVPATETTSEVEQPQNTNYKPETEDMEVHHHTHAAHGKKNWKSYFWEFLMLFLAVTLGFIVENQREHYIEHKRAKDYAMSLMEEVAGDTIALSQSVSYYKTKTESIDTLIGLLAGNVKQIPGGTLYYYADM